MKIHAFRLKVGDDIKLKIDEYVTLNNIKAGVLLCGTGNIRKARIRLANENVVKDYEDEWGFEIVSLSGTISTSKNHIHISFSDKEGQTFGGHLKEGNIVRITCEIILGEIEGMEFIREFDKESGFDELVVKKT